VGAALVLAAGQELTDTELIEYFKEALSGYKRPRGVLLLREEQVPMTGSGKVQKVQLRERLLGAMQEQGTEIVRVF